jgi:hypothetical protein
MRAVSREVRDDDHIAHAMTRGALLKLIDYEAVPEAAGKEG